MTWLQKVVSNKDSLGIDIGTSEIKAMYVKGGPGGVRVVSTGRESLPEGAMDSGSIVKGNQLAKALSSLVGKMGVNQQRVVTAVSGKHVIMRHLKLPPMPDAEVAQAIKWEADKYIPLPEDQLIMEYINFGEEDTEERQLNVLLVAVPKKLVYQYYEVFSLAGLELAAIDVEPLALWRLLPKDSTKAGPVALVDIGGFNTNILIVSDNRIAFTRSFAVGGVTLINSIANSLMMDFQSARKILQEKAKVPPADMEPGKLSHLDFAVKEGVGQLLHEVKRSLDFSKIQLQGQAAQRIFLSGGPAKLPGLIECFQTELELRAEQLNPGFTWTAEDLPGQEKGVLHPAWAIAAGLAAREVAANGTN